MACFAYVDVSLSWIFSLVSTINPFILPQTQLIVKNYLYEKPFLFSSQNANRWYFRRISFVFSVIFFLLGPAVSTMYVSFLNLLKFQIPFTFWNTRISATFFHPPQTTQIPFCSSLTLSIYVKLYHLITSIFPASLCILTTGASVFHSFPTNILHSDKFTSQKNTQAYPSTNSVFTFVISALLCFDSIFLS